MNAAQLSNRGSGTLKLPPDRADPTLEFAWVVAPTGSATANLEPVMGLKSAKSDPGDDHLGFTDIRLRMARGMRRRHEPLLLTTPALTQVILDEGLTAVEPVRVANTLEDPLRRVTLLL